MLPNSNLQSQSGWLSRRVLQETRLGSGRPGCGRLRISLGVSRARGRARELSACVPGPAIQEDGERGPPHPPWYKALGSAFPVTGMFCIGGRAWQTGRELARGRGLCPQIPVASGCSCLGSRVPPNFPHCPAGSDPSRRERAAWLPCPSTCSAGSGQLWVLGGLAPKAALSCDLPRGRLPGLGRGPAGRRGGRSFLDGWWSRLGPSAPFPDAGRTGPPASAAAGPPWVSAGEPRTHCPPPVPSLLRHSVRSFGKCPRDPEDGPGSQPDLEGWLLGGWSVPPTPSPRLTPGSLCLPSTGVGSHRRGRGSHSPCCLPQPRPEGLQLGVPGRTPSSPGEMVTSMWNAPGHVELC